MNWLTLINMIFSYTWLLAALWLAWRIYRTGVERTRRVMEIEKTLTDVMRANANAAITAAESAREAVETIHNIVALLSKDAAP